MRYHDYISFTAISGYWRQESLEHLIITLQLCRKAKNRLHVHLLIERTPLIMVPGSFRCITSDLLKIWNRDSVHCNSNQSSSFLDNASLKVAVIKEVG